MPTRPPTARLIAPLRRAVLASADTGPTDGTLLAEFVRTGDEDAFAALVRRHGPMVLGVCRRVVGDRHAAEDAFQAAFLVLARRAAAVRPRERVGNFLYGVAYRVALKARAVRARRRTKEAQVDPMPHPRVQPPDVWDDLRPVLDDELARLPDKLRLPVVLCDLEGRPQREVARQLGLPPATLANRLASARRTLAKRLTDRGVALSGGALAAVVTANAASAAVPPALAGAAVRAAGLVAAGGALTGAVPAQVVQLSDGVIRMMALSKLKSVVAMVVAACAVAGGTGVGALPALRAADDPAGGPGHGAKADPTKPGLGSTLGDAEFLRRVCLDLRGTLPSEPEVRYFVADPDPGKRRKVVGWLTEPGNWNVDVRFSKFVVDQLAPVREVVLTPPRVAEVAKYTVSLTEPVQKPEQVREQRVELLSDDAKPIRLAELAARPPGVAYLDLDNSGTLDTFFTVRFADSDEEFLKRVCQDVRGTPPTAIEREYFLADKDPAKREKLLDLFLKDPEVAKKLGAEWKKKVLGVGTAQDLRFFQTYELLQPPAQSTLRWTVINQVVNGPLDALLGQLLDGKRTDDQVLDALSAAVLGRLPTESERKLTLAAVGKAQDKPAAWREVLTALSGTDEARKHADELKARAPAPRSPEPPKE